MKEFSYVVTDPIGLHARPAGVLVNLVKKFSSNVLISKGNKKAEGKKLMALMLLGIKQGEEITVNITGEDEEEACSELEKFLKENL